MATRRRNRNQNQRRNQLEGGLTPNQRRREEREVAKIVENENTLHDAAQATYRRSGVIDAEEQRMLAVARRTMEIGGTATAQGRNRGPRQRRANIEPPEPRRRRAFGGPRLGPNGQSNAQGGPRDGGRSACSGPFCKYAESLADPFATNGAKGALGVGNVVPTYNSFASTTTSIGNTIITTGQGHEWTMFPGHGEPLGQASSHSSVDQQSNSGHVHLIGGVAAGDQYVIGPIKGTTTPRQAIGFHGPTTLGNTLTTSTAALTVPLTNDVALPFTILEGSGHHTRWRLVSMGMRLWNTTAEGDRGGVTVFSQPPQMFSNSAIQQFARFSPNFTLTSVASSDAGLEIVWLPRAMDLGYWQSLDSASDPPTGATQVGGLRLWYTNETPNSQVLRWEIVCHWEISGAELQTLQKPTDGMVHGAAVLESAIEKVRKQADTGHGLGTMIKHVAGQAVGAISQLVKDPRVQQGAKKAALSLSGFGP